MPRQVDDLDPSLLADLDSEADYAKTTQRRKFMPRIKIERGQAMLLRFLPVEIGANKHWLGRFAQHWVHNRAIFCRRHTSEHLGGDRNYDCPICKMVENGLHHQNKSVVERAEKCIADPRWYGVVLPLSKDSGKGGPVSIPEPDCVTAHEFTMYRTMFDRLRLVAGRYAIKGTQGIVDINNGQDIWVQRTGRGYEFQPGGSAPLWGPQDNPQEIINKIWSTVILPEITMPERAQETEFFHKIKEWLLTGGGGFENARGNGGGGGGSRGGRGYAAPENNDLDQDGGMPSAPTTLPARGGRGAAAPVAANELEEAQPTANPALADTSLDEGFGAPTATPPPAAARPAPAAAAPVAQAPVSAPVAPQPPVAAPIAQAPVQAPAPTVPTVPSAPAVKAPASKLIAPPRTSSSAQPPAAPAAITPPVTGATPEDEEDGVAPENHDAAPPIVEQPAEPVAVAAAPTPAPFAAPIAPPTVKAPGTRLATSLQSRLTQFQGKVPTVPTAPVVPPAAG